MNILFLGDLSNNTCFFHTTFKYIKKYNLPQIPLMAPLEASETLVTIIMSVKNKECLRGESIEVMLMGTVLC